MQHSRTANSSLSSVSTILCWRPALVILVASLVLLTGCQEQAGNKGGSYQSAGDNQTDFKVVMLENEPGYELHIPRASAEKLQSVVNDDAVVGNIQALLENGVSAGSTAAGLDPMTADVFSRIIGALFQANAEQFKSSLASNMGSAGIILTIKPNRPWVIKTGGELGIKFDITDPIGTTFHNNQALIDWLLAKAGASEAVEANKQLRKRFRELTWANETPPTVLINSSEWSIRPRN
jgi:hypothetical protein